MIIGRDTMENIAAFKSDRLLQMYSRLVNGEILSKQNLAQQFGVTQRSIQRDIESLRCFITEQGLSQEIFYDRNAKGYILKDQKQRTLTNSEILAVCKILLESRSMNREEMMPILDKLLDCCVPAESKKAVASQIVRLAATIHSPLSTTPQLKERGIIRYFMCLRLFKIIMVR